MIRTRSHASLIGSRFGRLTVISEEIRRHGPRHSFRWCLCQCECGDRRWYKAGNLLAGATRSCGCLKREIAKQNATIHGLSATAEYGVWQHMKSRCSNPNVEYYPIYGGRGIRVCDEWSNSFERFFSDMGPRPSHLHSIDRKDNDGPYSPDNCRWATNTEQHANQRPAGHTRWLEWNGRRDTMRGWSRTTGIERATIAQRLKLGWTIEAALSTPPERPSLPYTIDGEALTLEQWEHRHHVPAADAARRIYLGWPIERAITHQVRRRRSS